MAGILNKQQLLDKYSDPDWRERYLEFSDFRDFLNGCILPHRYSIPDEMNAAIKLTDAGDHLLRKLTVKYSVNAKDARLRCLLKLAHVDLLIDLHKSNLDQLWQSLGSQVENRKLLFPNSYGRELYDKSALLFEDETPRLTHEQTIDLLSGTSIGVYQIGQWTVGPWGAVKSLQKRWNKPQGRVPLYHCPSLGCGKIHESVLESNHKASINECAGKVHDALREISPKPSEWSRFEFELLRQRKQLFDDTSTLPLHWLIGDCFDRSELIKICSELLDRVTKGRLREQIGSLGLRGPASAMLESLDAGQIVHLILLSEDSSIIQAIEGLIWSGAIITPPNEIRRPVTNSRQEYGSFRLRPECSRLGVRFTSDFPGLPHLRLHRLIDRIFDKRVPEYANEFDWQFRGADPGSRDAKQEQILRELSPREVLSRVALSQRTSMIAACETLGVDPDRDVDDNRRVDEFLWKLGYDVDPLEDENEIIWHLHASMTSVAQTAHVSASVNEDSIRGLASRFFVELEKVLSDSLAFATWCLTCDHLGSSAPFIYRTSSDRENALASLEEFVNQGDSESERLRVCDGKASLFSLFHGFGVLAKMLEQLVSNQEGRKRDLSELPVSPHGSDLRVFPFMHFELFLDLTSQAQGEIVRGLKEVEAILSGEQVNVARNDWLHYRRSGSSVKAILDCLEAVTRALLILEALGFARLLFEPVEVSADQNSRTLTRFRDRRGRIIEVAGPSRCDLTRLPRVDETQYLVTSCALSGWGDFLRVGRQEESAYTRLWNGYPQRRGVSKGTSENAADASVADEAHDGIRPPG